MDLKKELSLFSSGISTEKVIVQLFEHEMYASEACNKRFTKEELQVLQARILSDDQAAVHELAMSAVQHMASIARSYARKRPSHVVTLAVLLSTGYFGLEHAARKYDASKGTFPNYATWWIHDAIKKEYLQHERLVRIEKDVLRKLSTYKRMRDEMLASGAHVTLSILAERMHIELEYAARLEEYANAQTITVHPSDEVQDNGGAAYQTLVDEGKATDESALAGSLQTIVKDCLRGLSEPERELLERFYGLRDGHEESLKEIAPAYGYTSRAIGMMRSRAEENLKKALEKRGVTLASLID